MAHVARRARPGRGSRGGAGGGRVRDAAVCTRGRGTGDDRGTGNHGDGSRAARAVVACPNQSRGACPEQGRGTVPSRVEGPARVSTFAPARASQASHATARVPELILNSEPAAEEPAIRSAAPLGDSFLGGGRHPSGQRATRPCGCRGCAVRVAGWRCILAAVQRRGDDGNGQRGCQPVPPRSSCVAAPRAARRAVVAVGTGAESRRGGARSRRSPPSSFCSIRNGGFVSSAKAGVDFKRLAPGDESPFVIAVDAPASVARYRVSFRTDAGVVPHVDRRGQDPVAATAVVTKN